MRRWIESLASLKLTVGLVLLLGVVLAAGTILDSTRGAEVAARTVYYAGWFFALQGLFALNLIAALVVRWPRNRWRIGFAITHLAMIVILLGALLTQLFKVEGQLPIWEGQESALVFRPSANGETPPYELPFRVRLDAFEIDVYPGTQRPAMFRSRVVVLDPESGERPAVIEMNRPLAHGGFSFFQSSYQIQGERRMTILAVSRDPGEGVVFLGYALLVAGMIWVFATRLVQHARLAANGASGALVAGLVAAALLAPAPAGAALVPDDASLAALRAVPVQFDGREMPFDTQARDTLRAVTGKRAWPGIDPVAMAFGWAIDPEGWSREPIVRLRADVAAVAGLPRGTRYASFADLVGRRELLDLVGAARARRQRQEGKPPKLDDHLLELEQRLVILDGYFGGQALRALPAAERVAPWGTVRPRSAAEMLDVERRLRADAATPAHYPTVAAIAREVRYNTFRPTRVAWLLLGASALAAGAALTRRRALPARLADATLLAGFAVITWDIVVRWQVAGRIPASNMYESMLFLAWGVGLFGAISIALRQRTLIFNAAAMVALATALLDLLPMDPFIHPMPPVLSGTAWLAIHVPIIMVGYAVFVIVTFFAHLVVGLELVAPARRDLARRWSQLLYWYTHVGSILLITGILTGSVWAASSWGRYWGWDPKEVWSLVAFLAYMAILHARFDQQIGELGVAVASIAAFWTILMTYLGVNFVLAAGLHSYGFGSSNLVRIFGVIALAEIAFVGAALAAARRRRGAAVTG
jgi:cytochrome c-type biogenesis protein CcsB